MPLTPSNGDKHAAPLIRLYRLLELALWRILAKLLGLERGWGRRWLTRMLMRLPNFRQATRRIVDDTADQAPGLVATAINRAWRDGTRAARADTGSHTEHFDDDAVQDIINRVLDGLDTAHRGVLADTENIYRRVVDEVARDPNIAGDNELATLLREALQRNARFGFVATTDQRGRRRELVAYAEQQIRAGVTAAEVDGFCAQALADGSDLFIVSDVPGACRLCAPFEGRVISITGTTVGAITRDTHTGRPVPVNVMCSLAEARARGLFHYGCRHTIKVWTPEDPTPPRAVRATEAGRAASRTVAAQRRRNRVTARVDAATTSGPDQIMARRRQERTARQTLADQHIPASPYDSARSATEVGEILRQRHGFEVTGFDGRGVDLTVAQEYARAIEDMVAEYPNARLAAVRIGKVADDVADKPGRRRTLAYVRAAPDVVTNGGSVEMVLNIDYARSYARFLTAQQASERQGWHTPNSHLRPTYSTIIHEWGHVLDNQARQNPRTNAVMALYNHYFNTYPPAPTSTFEQREQALTAWLHQLSGYSFKENGQLNPPEALAEAFTDVKNNGDQASEPAKVLYKLLMDELGGGAP